MRLLHAAKARVRPPLRLVVGHTLPHELGGLELHVRAQLVVELALHVAPAQERAKSGEE